MKALTIREPWASLIINGYKKYEFRSRKINYRGKILIHAGKKVEAKNLLKFKDYQMEYHFGEIIGEAILTDCIKVDKKWLEERKKEDPLVYDKSGLEEEYAWELSNVIKYKNPIPADGKLGLWNYEGEKNEEEFE